MSTTSLPPVPGLNDLIPNMLVRPADPEHMAKAASNVHLPAIKGIAAIGSLLAAVSDRPLKEWEIEEDDLYDLGYLLKHLAETAELAHHVRCWASYWMQEDAQSDAGTVED